MALERKVAIYPSVGEADEGVTINVVRKPNDPNAYVASGPNVTGPVGAETAARIAGDEALANELTTETNARTAADTTLTNNLATETTNRTNADTALGTRITNETTARVAGDTAAMFATFNLSTLPTADPGGGKPWLSGGNIHVGP